MLLSDYDRRAAIFIVFLLSFLFRPGIDVVYADAHIMAEVEKAEALARQFYGNCQYDSALTQINVAIDHGPTMVDKHKLCELLIMRAAFLAKIPDSMAASLEVCEQAKRIAEKNKFADLMVYIHNRLAGYYYSTNEYRAAITHFRAADSIALLLNRSRDRVHPLQHLAHCYQQLGKQQIADSVFDIVIPLAVKTGKIDYLAWVYIYRAHSRLKEKSILGVAPMLAAAADIFAEYQDSKGLIELAYMMGRYERLRGNYARAIHHLDSARAGFSVAGEKLYPVKELGLTYLASGLVDSALFYFTEAQMLFDSVHTNIPRADFKWNYLVDKHDIVDGLVRCHLQKGDVEKAFNVAEAFRARAFQESIVEHKNRESCSPEFQSQRDSINRTISDILRNVRLCATPAGESNAIFDQLQAAHDMLIDARLTESGKNPLKMHLTAKSSQTFKQQAKSNCIGLYYFVHEDHLLVWYTDGQILRVNDISKEFPAVIELVSAVLDLLSTQPDWVAKAEELKDLLEYLNCLLPREIRSRLSSLDELVIYPAGILSYFPFETICIDGKYLGEMMPIVYYPSLSIHELQSQRLVRHDTLSSIAMFGGSFDADVTITCSSPTREVPATFQQIHPIPGVEGELKGINRYFRDNDTTFFNQTDQEELIRGMDLAQFDILHFATHGIIFDDFPEFSGLILPIDELSVQDEILRLEEVTELRAANPLVVLSACKSGYGRYITGEGIQGLSRSFLVAGVKSLVVSLWPIHDKVSSLFMEKFYSAIKNGESTGAALQVARKWVIQESPFKHPYYWAPLIAISDWKTSPAPGK